MLEVQGISYVYPGTDKPALENVSFKVEPGEFITIVGPNGSGKSTLARHLNGLLKPTKGRVLVDGLDTAREENLIDIRRRVGMVFQDPDNQIIAATVEDDVAFGLENLGLPPGEIRQRVAAALEAVKLAGLRSRPPYGLSGGQKQRLALAGVLAMQPRYLVLDEATSMLDPLARVEILQHLLHLCRERGIAVIFITHMMEEAIKSERMLILKEGKVILTGTPAQLMYKLNEITGAGLRPPVTVALSEGLRQKGIKLPPKIFTLEELAHALWRLNSKK